MLEVLKYSKIKATSNVGYVRFPDRLDNLISKVHFGHNVATNRVLRKAKLFYEFVGHIQPNFQGTSRVVSN